MPDLTMHLLGEPRLSISGSPVPVSRRKAWALLAYLALSDQRQNRDVLATLLWPDLDQTRARAALRSTLSTLTTRIPGGWLESERAMLALDPSAVQIDVREFLSLLAQSRVHKHESPSLCPECLGYLLDAVALYQADFMLGFGIAESNEYEDWQLMQREWLRREFSYALRRLAVYYGEVHAYETAIEFANRWLALDSLHEPAHRLLMRLYAESGQRAEALRQYQRCAALLDAELATPPEQETTRLYEQIQADTPVTSRAAAAPDRPAVNVLPPLPPLLVGREQTLRDIKRHLGIGGESRPLTVIQGWPGVGKSTTVAALAHDRDVIEAFPDGILWTSLGETPGIGGELALWAKALGLIDSAKGREIAVDVLIAQLTAALRDRQMLLIVDDVWKVEHAQPFRVGGQSCVTLMTSRLNDVAEAIAPTAADLYRLPVLPEAEGVDLLARLTPETVTQYPQEARLLVRNLEGLPLAIQVAGRLLHTEARLGWGVTELLRELHVGGSLLNAPAPSDMASAESPSPTIAALLRRSTDSLDAETRQRFALLGLFVPKPATFDLNAMAAAWNVMDARVTARALVNRGLLEPVSGGRFQMHALLVLHARSLLEEGAAI